MEIKPVEIINSSSLHSCCCWVWALDSVSAGTLAWGAFLRACDPWGFQQLVITVFPIEATLTFRCPLTHVVFLGVISELVKPDDGVSVTIYIALLSWTHRYRGWRTLPVTWHHWLSQWLHFRIWWTMVTQALQEGCARCWSSLSSCTAGDRWYLHLWAPAHHTA